MCCFHSVSIHSFHYKLCLILGVQNPPKLVWNSHCELMTKKDDISASKAWLWRVFTCFLSHDCCPWSCCWVWRQCWSYRIWHKLKGFLTFPSLNNDHYLLPCSLLSSRLLDQLLELKLLNLNSIYWLLVIFTNELFGRYGHHLFPCSSLSSWLLLLGLLFELKLLNLDQNYILCCLP